MLKLVEDPWSEPKLEGWTRFVCFSDTHGHHASIPDAHLFPADVLLHAGDFTNAGELEQVQSFAAWLKAYPAEEKVVIAGNHDITFDDEYYSHFWKDHHSEPYECGEVRGALSGCHYLLDESIQIMGYRIYGSPWQPVYRSWAFNLPHGPPLAEAWEAIPHDLDILMTHGPPNGIRDRIQRGRHVGCRQLREAIAERRVPVSLFGHIHEGYGIEVHGPTTYINASTCTLNGRPINRPIVFDLHPAESRQSSKKARTVPTSLGPPGAEADPACPVCDGTGLLLGGACPLCDGCTEPCEMA